MVSALASGAVRVRALGELRCVFGTVTVPLFTQVYKLVPANLMLGGNLAMD